MVTDRRRDHIGERTRSDVTPDDDAFTKGSSLRTRPSAAHAHTTRHAHDQRHDTTRTTYAEVEASSLALGAEVEDEEEARVRRQRVERLEPSCRPLSRAVGGERMRKAASEAPFTSPSAALRTSNARTFRRFIARSSAVAASSTPLLTWHEDGNGDDDVTATSASGSSRGEGGVAGRGLSGFGGFRPIDGPLAPPPPPFSADRSAPFVVALLAPPRAPSEGRMVA
jgi:hypothetical protein